MKKKEIKKLLKGVNEVISIDIPDDLYKEYEALAINAGVSTEDYISAVVIKYVRGIVDGTVSQVSP